MNRSNVGNVVTNGMQILSVGAVTGSKVFSLGKANSALNNTDSVDDVMSSAGKSGNTPVEKPKDNKGIESPLQEDGLDADVSSHYMANSEQIKDITTKLKNDNNFLDMWKNVTRDEKGRFAKKNVDVGGTKNADV